MAAVDGAIATDDVTRSLRALGERLAGEVVLEGDESWDGSRRAWNLAVDQQPLAVVLPASAADVVATVELAAEHGLSIAFNAGGHNAGTIDWDEPTLLLKTERMRGIRIDPDRRTARVEAGVLAKPLALAAGEHDLAFLSGTSADVGVVGYALGGGLSWLGRAHGLACNSIVAADVVLADGRQVHTDRDTEPELFWALRGGGGNVAAVTALEFQLLPLTEVYAGALFWPIDRASEVLTAWRHWIDDLPDTCQSLGRMLQLPDAPFLPEHLRGRSFVLVEAAIIGSEADGIDLLRPIRALEPELDSFTMMPPSDLSLVNMDPEEPASVRRRWHAPGRLPAGGDRPPGRDLRRLTAAAHRGAPARWRVGGRLSRTRRARRDRAAVRPVHVRLGVRSGDARCGPGSRPSRPRGDGAVGQRSSLPELRRDAGGSADDLSGGDLRSPARGEAKVRPE